MVDLNGIDAGMGIPINAEHCRKEWLAQVYQYAELLQPVVPRGGERDPSLLS